MLKLNDLVMLLHPQL